MSPPVIDSFLRLLFVPAPDSRVIANTDQNVSVTGEMILTYSRRAFLVRQYRASTTQATIKLDCFLMLIQWLFYMPQQLQVNTVCTNASNIQGG